MEAHDTSENLQARLFAAEQQLLAEGIPVKIRLPQNTGTAHVVLALQRKEYGQDARSPVCKGCVSVGLYDRALWTRAQEIVKTQVSPLVLSRNDWEICLYKTVPPDGIVDFKDILADLMGEWSRLWQRVGGLGGRALKRTV